MHDHSKSEADNGGRTGGGLSMYVETRRRPYSTLVITWLFNMLKPGSEH